jgi:hypothetical protein
MGVLALPEQLAADQNEHVRDGAPPLTSMDVAWLRDDACLPA